MSKHIEQRIFGLARLTFQPDSSATSSKFHSVLSSDVATARAGHGAANAFARCALWVPRRLDFTPCEISIEAKSSAAPAAMQATGACHEDMER